MLENKPISIRKFLGRPTLGGWLTIANCLAWAAFILVTRPGPHELNGVIMAVVVVVFFIIAAPLAILFWLPTFGHPSFDDIMAQSVMAGLNSILWGYGLAWVIRKIRAQERGE